MKNLKHLSRRKFLRQASCAGLGYTTLFSTLSNLKCINAAAIDNSSLLLGGDYKALVCISFGGGCDSFNMLMPTNQTAYDEYATSRSNLAIPRNQILSLNNTEHGIHPSMYAVQQLFNDGKLSFLSNVGTLLEPVTKEDAWNNDAKLPLGLFSHSDQTRQWQTSIPNQRVAVGWGGKIADLIGDTNDNESISLNISLSGRNIFQTGNRTIDFTVDRYDDQPGIIGYNENWWLNAAKKRSIEGMLEIQQEDLFKKTYANILGTAIDANLLLGEALESVTIETTFSKNDLSIGLQKIAKIMAARQTLGMKRQIFFLDYGGWDHHDEVLMAQEEMLGEVSHALEEFKNALEELGLFDQVTTFTMSEFGRTLTSNGNGTDHGWGGNTMVMGGAVNGGQIFGNYPSLALNSELEVGGGVFIPTTSVDEYFSELAIWLGVSPSALSDIFPNIGNFYDANSSELPIGFLNG